MTRLEKIREQIKLAGVDGLLVTSHTNRRYVSEFSSSAGAALITMDKAYYIVDSRYIEAAQKNVSSEYTVIQLSDTFAGDIAKMCEELGVKKLGFENWAMSVGECENYKKYVKAELVPFNRGIEFVRRIKEDKELDSIKKALAISEKSFNALLPQIKIGMTEKEVATILMHEFNKNGGQGMAFEVIAVSGPNSSLPHGVPGERKLQDGDFLTIDFGARFNGYCSDTTRTVAIGSATEEMVAVYNTVLKAQLAAIEFARVGNTGVEIDAAARDIITKAGYGQYFQHGLGHCLGIDNHEDPRANTKDTTVFEQGYVLTIEPGIYLPGKFGVRIEDLIYFGKNGVENFTTLPKELIIIK